MRGGQLHNEVILRSIREDLLRYGAEVREEHRVVVSGTPRYVDLLAVAQGGHRLVVEAELSSRRVGNDLAKARALGASALLIVTHSPEIARRCRRAARRESSRFGGEVFIHPLGPARAALSRWFSLISRDISGG